MDSHSLVKLAHMLHRVYLAVVNGKRRLIETSRQFSPLYPVREGWFGDLIQCLVHGIITQTLTRWALMSSLRARLLFVGKGFTWGGSWPPLVTDILFLVKGCVWVGKGPPLLCTAQLLFQVVYLSLHGLIVVSPLGYATTYLGVALARLSSMYASLSISSIAWIWPRVRRIILPLRPNKFCLLRVSLAWIFLV